MQKTWKNSSKEKMRIGREMEYLREKMGQRERRKPKRSKMRKSRIGGRSV